MFSLRCDENTHDLFHVNQDYIKGKSSMPVGCVRDERFDCKDAKMFQVGIDVYWLTNSLKQS